MSGVKLFIEHWRGISHHLLNHSLNRKEGVWTPKIIQMGIGKKEG